MAVKPWPQITSTYEAAQYILAELADAQKYCPDAVAGYQSAYAAAQGMLAMDWDEMTRSTLEGALQLARSTWTTRGCSRPSASGGTTSDPSHDADAGAGDEYGSPGGGGSGSFLWLAVGGVALYLLLGKKGKGKKSSRKSSRRRR